MRIDSEVEAEKLVCSILRDARTRRRCLETFTDAVREAHRHGAEAWAITCSQDKVRLQVGPVIICNIGDRKAGTERLFLALDRDSLGSDKVALLEGTGDWEWVEGKWATYRVIPTRNGQYFPSERHEDLWGEVKELHLEAIRKAAQRGGLRQKTKARHSSEIVKYLRSSLGRSVPDPEYSG